MYSTVYTIYVLQVGVIFERENINIRHSASCAKLVQDPQIQDFTLYCYFLNLRRASENVNCAPKWARQFVFCPKIVQFFYITFLSLHQRGVSSFNILEAKIEEKVVQNLFDFDQVKHQFVHFLGPKKIETFLNFEFSCWRFF